MSVPTHAGDVHEPRVALPASSGQQRLWFFDQLAPGTPLHNVHLGTELRGPLVPEALGSALEAVVRRHEALRTTLRAMDGVPRQVVVDDLSIPTTLHDLTHLVGQVAEEPADGAHAAHGARGAQSEIAARAAAHAATVFDLARGPLLRSDLLRLGPAHHVWLLTLHHVVCDGRSATLLFEEMSEVYRATVEERPHRLPPLPLQYADYAVWQQETRDRGGFEPAVASWRRRLEDAPGLLPLPTDRPRPPAASFAGALVSTGLTAVEDAAVRTLAHAAQVTRFQVVLAALAVVLHRMSGTEDILVGTAVDGRNRVELESLVGFFSNTVPLRVRVPTWTGFAALLGHVRDVVLDAQSHADVPFELLVRELRPQRHTRHHPVFQVLLDVQHCRADALRLSDVTSRDLRLLDRRTALVDLGVSIVDGQDGTRSSVSTPRTCSTGPRSRGCSTPAGPSCSPPSPSPTVRWRSCRWCTPRWPGASSPTPPPPIPPAARPPDRSGPGSPGSPTAFPRRRPSSTGRRGRRTTTGAWWRGPRC